MWVAAAAMGGCSSSGGGAPSTPAIDGGAPTGVSDAGGTTTNDKDSGSLGPTDAAAGLAPDVLGNCTVPDPPHGLLPHLFVRNESDGIGIYLGGFDTSQMTEFHRYTIGSTNPCTLVRDTGFGTGGVVTAQATDFVDAKRHIWSGILGSNVTRILPATPAVECTRPFGLGGLPYFAFTEDGASGYVFYPTTFASDPRQWGKLAITGDTCTFTLMDQDPAGFVDSRAIAVDSKGRLHAVVITQLPNEKRADDVTIFAPTGAKVTSYLHHEYELETFEGSWEAIGQCGDGLCLVAHQGGNALVTRVDADGKVLGQAILKGTEDDHFEGFAIAGAVARTFLAVSDGRDIRLSIVGL